jgi:hypothetical protein
MKKYLLLLFAIALIATSCENATETKDSKASEVDKVVVEKIVPVAVAEFDEKAGEFVGKKIELTGVVDHICQHGGQRLFLVSEDSDARIKITPDEEIAAFNIELEGNRINIVGVVEEQRIDEAYLREWEEEIKSGSDMADGKGEGSHIGGKVEKGGEGANIDEEMVKVNDLREMIAESGDDHLSFYSVLCTSYDIINDADVDNDHEGHEHDKDDDHEGHDHDH